MAKLNGFLGSLGKEVHRRRKPTKRRRSCHYDSGMAIDLRYDSGFYPPEASVAASSSFSTSEDPWAAPFGGGSYQVEAFEDGGEAMDDVPVWGTGELFEAVEASVGQSFSDEASLIDLPVWGTGELEGLLQEAQSLSDEEEPEADDEATFGTGELEDLDDGQAEEDEEPQFRVAASAQPTFSQSRKVETLSVAPDDPESLAFAQDLQAILAGQKEHPSTQRPDPFPTPENDEDEPPPPVDHRAPHEHAYSHSVFDAMGKNMSMATTFDLGSHSLAHQFDLWDRQIDARSVAPARPSATGFSVTSREFAEDLAHLSRPVSTPLPVRAMEVPPALNLKLEVPLVPQQTGMSCWAASCAMIVGWRENMSVDPSEVASASGHWAQYASGLAPEDASVFPVWDMAPEAAQSYTVQGFYDLLDRYGPLWVASAEPGAHVRVVTGMVGDGTPDGTTLTINDPWEAGMAAFRLPNAGSRTTETYTQFVRKQESLARQELNVHGIYVAHNRSPRPR